MAVRRTKVLTRPFAIRLEEKAWEDVSQIASALRTSPTALMREWIMERLALEREASEGFHSGRLPEDIEAYVLRAMVQQGMEQMRDTAREAFAKLRDEVEDEVLARLEERGLVIAEGEELAEATG